MTNDAPEAIIAAIPEDTPVDGEVLLEKLNHQIVKVTVITHNRGPARSVSARRRRVDRFG